MFLLDMIGANERLGRVEPRICDESVIGAEGATRECGESRISRRNALTGKLNGKMARWVNEAKPSG